MNARERVLILQLAERVQRQPAFAEMIGISITECRNNVKEQKSKAKPKYEERGNQNENETYQ